VSKSAYIQLSSRYPARNFAERSVRVIGQYIGRTVFLKLAAMEARRRTIFEQTGTLFPAKNLQMQAM
jgi:hypothetical protein